MKDTPEEIMMLQHKIFMAKTPEERFMLALQMIEDGISICSSGIKDDHPAWTEREIRIELFKRLYTSDFNDEELKKIIQHLKTIEL